MPFRKEITPQIRAVWEESRAVVAEREGDADEFTDAAQRALWERIVQVDKIKNERPPSRKCPSVLSR